MKKGLIVTINLLLLFSSSNMKAQTVRFANFEATPFSVFMSKVNMMGKNALKAVKDSAVKEFDEPTFIRINGVDFRNGTI